MGNVRNFYNFIQINNYRDIGELLLIIVILVPFFYFKNKKNKLLTLIIRVIYSFIAIIIVNISIIFPKINYMLFNSITWLLIMLICIPYPKLINKNMEIESNDIIDKIFIFFIPIYILVSNSYEIIFIIFLYITLKLWLYIRTKNIKYVMKNQKYKVVGLHTIDTILYIFFIYESFFSLYNESTFRYWKMKYIFRFIPEFNKYFMILLILFKIFFPLILISLSFYGIYKVNKFKWINGLIEVTAYSDILSIIFLLFMKEKGSSQQILISVLYFFLVNFISASYLFLFGMSKLIYFLNKSKLIELDKNYNTTNTSSHLIGNSTDSNINKLDNKNLF